MNQEQEPMGPLMKAVQKYVSTFVCVVDAMLLIGATRYLPVSYSSWLYWVGVILAVFLLVVMVPVLKDMYSKPQK